MLNLKNIIIFLFLLFSFNITAQAPIAGSILENQAEVIFYDTSTGVSKIEYSNKVSLVVGTVLDFSLNPKNIKYFKNRGEEVYFYHTVKNLSNTSADINIKYNNKLNDDFNLLNLEAYIDIDKNGVIDSLDQYITVNTNNLLNFNYNEEKNIIIKGNVPELILGFSKSLIDLEASILLKKTENSINEVEVLAEPFLDISGSVNKNTAYPLDTVEFSFNAENISLSDAYQTEIFIDGALENKIIVESKIPANSTFISKETGNENIFLYHMAGSPNNVYVTTPPINLGSIDKIVFAYNTFEKDHSEQGSYSVSINSNATDFIKTKFKVIYETSIEEKTNETLDLIVTLPSIPISFDYYDENFINIKKVAKLSDDLNLRASAAACNIDSSIQEEYNLRLEVEKSNDLETFIKIKETSNNSGVFEIEDIEIRHYPTNTVVQDNNIIEAEYKDTVKAILNCNSQEIDTEILIDPLGVVFNSKTNAPISNVKVTLLGVDNFGNTFIPEVRDEDYNLISNVFITNAAGIFRFPLVQAGNYKFELENFVGYTYPSTVIPSELPTNRTIHSNGSFGGVFNVSVNDSIVTIDIPLDPIANNDLMIQKTVDKKTAEITDSLNYTLKIKNQSIAPMLNVKVEDHLPFGFEFVGTKSTYSYTLNNNKIEFIIPEIKAGETVEISYKVFLKLNSLNGNGINLAKAYNNDYISNTASIKVKVNKSTMFSPIILGKVFKDCNDNGIKDEEEIGYPGVKIYLDNGVYAITDNNGNYKFYDLIAKTYSMRIDKESLVSPYRFKTVDNRNGLNPFSRFVDLKFGELHRADFRDTDCSNLSLNRIKERNSKFKDIKNEIEKKSEKELKLTELETVVVKNDKNSGILGLTEIEVSNIYNNEKKILENNNSNNLDKYKLLEGSLDFEKLLNKAEITTDLDFMDLEEGDILLQNQIPVRIKGRSITNIKFYVNSIEINENRIGQLLKEPSKKLQLKEYIAVKLKSGLNLLEIKEIDPFGNIRKERTIKITAPGELKKVKINLPPENKIPANSSQIVPVAISLLDNNDIPILGKYLATLDNTIGNWDVKDINNEQAGIQVFIENGESVFDFIPPNNPMKGTVNVEVNGIKKEEELNAVPFMRDLFAVGIIEGAINLKNRSNLTENIKTTGLEEEIKSFEIGNKTTGSMSLFLKGKVRGDYLLTLSYDSDKDSKEKLFKDINPEKYYPIYGDSSVNGFEAQSTSKLFVKVEKNDSFILYGDYTTNTDSTEFNLGNYNRTLTGIKHVYKVNKVKIAYFLAEESYSSRISEIQGRGTSGPYSFSNNEEVITSSENVYIITKDKDTNEVISKIKQERFRDYEINGFYDGLIFRKPIPSYDSNLNPVYVRVEYETDSETKKYFVYGFYGTYNFNKNLSIGSSYHESKEIDNEYNVKSANIKYKNEKLEVITELAESDYDNKKGQAKRLIVNYVEAEHQLELSASTADEDYKNDYSTVKPNVDTLRLKSSSKIKNITLNTDTVIQKDNTAEKKISSVKATVAKSLEDTNLRIETGVRHNQTKTKINSIDSTLASARLNWQPEFNTNINAYIEHEQDISKSEIYRNELGLEYKLKDDSKLYYKQETLSNLNSAIELSEKQFKQNRNVFGINYDLSEDTDVYSEYRIDEAIEGRESEAVLGIKNKYVINDNWKGNVAFERIQNVEGDKNHSMSISTSLQYTESENSKYNGKLEYRTDGENDSYLTSLGHVKKLNDNYSLLLKDTFSYEELDNNYKNRLFTGLAYRDNELNNLNYLLKYENEWVENDFSKEIKDTFSIQLNRRVRRDQVLSASYAFKTIDNNDYKYKSNWLAGRYSWDINNKWDLGVSGAYLFDNETFDNYIIGLETGYLVGKNMWLSVGYNFEGLSDNKFDNNDYTKEGLYLRFRINLDENNFEWLK